jgi:sRNA-binding regulator protein Hfq
MSDKATTDQPSDVDFLRQLSRQLNATAPKVAGQLRGIANNYAAMLARSHKSDANFERRFYEGADKFLVTLTNGDSITGSVIHHSGYTLLVKDDHNNEAMIQKSGISTVRQLKA